MARHTRANDHNEEVSLPRSASDLLREAGYDMPDTRRRRRRERSEEPAAPPPVERTMFPYRRPEEAERARPAQRTPAAPPTPPVQPTAPVRSTPPPAPAQPHRIQSQRDQPPARSQPVRPPFGEPSRAATRWAAEQAGPQIGPRTGPQTGPQTWPPQAAPSRGPVVRDPVVRGPVSGPVGRAASGSVAAPRRDHAPGQALPDLEGTTRLAPVQPLPARQPAGQPAEDVPLHRLPSTAGRQSSAQMRAAPSKRAVQPEYDERPPDRRRARVAPDPVEEDGGGTATERSLLREWAVFLLETLVAAAMGLGLWLGFHILWSVQPMYAAGGCAVVIVGLHIVAGLIRRRQTGGEYDLLTSAVVTAVGVAITVLPAAFIIHPG